MEEIGDLFSRKLLSENLNQRSCQAEKRFYGSVIAPKFLNFLLFQLRLEWNSDAG
jgi:hypothetical protein